MELERKLTKLFPIYRRDYILNSVRNVATKIRKGEIDGRKTDVYEIGSISVYSFYLLQVVINNPTVESVNIINNIFPDCMYNIRCKREEIEIMMSLGLMPFRFLCGRIDNNIDDIDYNHTPAALYNTGVNVSNYLFCYRGKILMTGKGFYFYNSILEFIPELEYVFSGDEILYVNLDHRQYFRLCLLLIQRIPKIYKAKSARK